MFKSLASFMIISLLISTLANSAVVYAENSKVVINEIMTASIDYNKDEFIEIVNTDISQIDISGWYLEYINSSLNTTQIYTFPDDSILYPNGSVVGELAQTPSATFLEDINPRFEYVLSGSSGMAISNVGIKLFDSSGIVQDAVFWTSSQSTGDTETAIGMEKSKSIERRVVNGLILNTDSNTSDFLVNDIPTPSASNIAPDPEVPIVDPPVIDPPPPVIDPPVSDPPPSDPPTTEPPVVVELPLISPIINELMIDPVSPQTDANDEWIEIYNPNNTEFNLEGFVVYAGETSNYKHTFLATDIISPFGFFVVTSKDTSIALSNSGGKVVLKNNTGAEVTMISYSTAQPGETWARDFSGNWQWSSTPTISSENIITQVLPIPVTPASTTTKKATTKVSTAKISSSTPKTPVVAKAKSTVVKSVADSKDGIGLVDAPVMVPPLVLALAGSLAVIYALYEYRFEVSNKIFQFKQYRINRQANRR
jgi:hypothetical protein